jgi:hypothetical protein
MSEMSKQFSLREMIGTVAPGAMVITALLYVLAKTPAGTNLGQAGAGWTALLVGFVLAYGAGILLTSLTQAVFEAVTKLRAAAAVVPERPADLVNRRSDQLVGHIDRLLRDTASYLSGGQDITSSIRQFRQAWETRAVPEGVVSEHAMSLAAGHYRSLFGIEPAGEEALLFCEFYVREKMPIAMQEIEQNAAKAALMGNLIIPMLFWLVAVGAGIVLAPINRTHIVGVISELILFLLLLALFPYMVRMIGRQWIEASRSYVRIVVVAFTIACRLSRSVVPEPRYAPGLLNT